MAAKFFSQLKFAHYRYFAPYPFHALFSYVPLFFIAVLLSLWGNQSEPVLRGPPIRRAPPSSYKNPYRLFRATSQLMGVPAHLWPTFVGNTRHPSCPHLAASHCLSLHNGSLGLFGGFNELFILLDNGIHFSFCQYLALF